MMIEVTSTADSGPGTLRAAVASANSASTPVQIDFDVNGAPAITLTSGQLELTNSGEPVTIDGPGSNLLAVSGNNSSGIFQIASGVKATISGCAFVNGSSSFGGAIYNQGDLKLRGCAFLDNTAPPYAGEHAAGPGIGGAIANYNGTLSLVDCTLSGNSANFGGAIDDRDAYSSTTVSLTDCRLSGNSAVLDESPSGNQGPQGGAINIENIYGKTTIALLGCTITGNSAGGEGTFGYGGGIADGGLGSQTTLTITDCTLSANSTTGIGGGVVNFYGTMTMEGCTVSGNSAGGGGGGVAASGTNTLINCTVAGNTAGTGGGIQPYGAGPLSLIACTVSGNTATGTTGAAGGGIYGATSQGNTPTANLTNTIVAANFGPDAQPSDIAGAAPFQVTGSHNLIGTGGSGGLTTAGHNLLNVANPGLTTLGDFGGPTETMALKPGSPAIHAGVAVTGLTTDQRGFPLDSPPDIGAYQTRPGPLVVNTAVDGTGSALGQLSVRQAVNLANVLPGGETITFNRSAFAGHSVIDLTAGQLELSNVTGAVNIIGPGARMLAISGNGASRVFQVDQGASASLIGLTITGGVTTGDGGGLLNDGTLSLAGVAVVGNSAANGGGVDNMGTALIVGSAIDENSASADGGGIFNTGKLTVTNSTLATNSAGADGGGLYNRGLAILAFSTVEGNSASAGGGIFADASGQPVALIGTLVKQNDGGDIFGRVIRV